MDDVRNMSWFGITFLNLKTRRRYPGYTTVLTLEHPAHTLTPFAGALVFYSLLAASPSRDIHAL